MRGLMTPHRCLTGGLLPSDAWFKRAGIWVTPGPFTGSSMGPASDGRLNSSVRFLRLVFQFLAAAADPPCLPETDGRRHSRACMPTGRQPLRILPPSRTHRPGALHLRKDHPRDSGEGRHRGLLLCSRLRVLRVLSGESIGSATDSSEPVPTTPLFFFSVFVSAFSAFSAVKSLGLRCLPLND